MDISNVIINAKKVIDLIDKWDNTTISFLEKISELPLMPEYIKVAVALLKKYEPMVIEYGKAGIDFIGTLIKGTEKAEIAGETVRYATPEIKSKAKLKTSITEVKKEIEKAKKEEEEEGFFSKLSGVTDHVNEFIGVINKVVKG